MQIWHCGSPTTAMFSRLAALHCPARRAICCTIRASATPIWADRPHESSLVTETDSGPATLEELEARLRRDFELLVMPPAKDWLEPRAHPEYGPVLDVAVIGAGMSGLAASFALKCLAIRSLKMFDRSPAGFEGPWATYARMETLRSPPELSGPSFGFANLTFRAWFEAQFGLAEWKTVHRIPRLQWMDYLRWYRRVIDVPVENDTELTDIGGDDKFVILTLRSPEGTRKIAARRVVLANGRDALG